MKNKKRKFFSLPVLATSLLFISAISVILPVSFLNQHKTNINHISLSQVSTSLNADTKTTTPNQNPQNNSNANSKHPVVTSEKGYNLISLQTTDLSQDTNPTSNSTKTAKATSQTTQDSGIYLKIPKLDAIYGDDTAVNNLNDILRVYTNAPSNFLTTTNQFSSNLTNFGTEVEFNNQKIWVSDANGIYKPTNNNPILYNNIYNLLGFDGSKWVLPNSSQIDERPMIFNLDNTQTYGGDNRRNVVNTVNNVSQFQPFSPQFANQSSNFPPFSFTANATTNNNNNQNNQLNTTFVNQNYLDAHGILALQITLTSATDNVTKASFYLFLSGFGIVLNNIALNKNPILDDRSAYSKPISDVPNSLIAKTVQVNSLLTADTNENASGTNPTTNANNNSSYSNLPTINVLDRKNFPLEGYFQTMVQYQWNLPKGLGFTTSFPGIVVDNDLNTTAGFGQVGGRKMADTNLVVSQKNQIYYNAMWQQQLQFDFFQRTSNFSQKDLIIVITTLPIAVLVLSISLYIFTKILNRLVFSRKRKE